MSSIHFFIAPENFTASPTDFFGPINTNQYRTTTHFTSANNAKAFAICKGHVLITPQIDAGGAEVENVVNVVLKPAEQPLQGLPIKYIIYRGLQLSSFFDDGKVIQTGTDLINKVQADFVSLHGNSGEVIFTADQLGYFSVGATGWEGSKKLSSAFFKVTDSSEPPEKAYELPLVQAGESIGLFIDDTCGIDVVLDYGDYELPASELAFDFNMDFARKATNSIDLANVSGGAFAQKVTREQIFQFIDVAAIYGVAQQQGLSVSSIDAQGNLRTETGDNIFSLITSKFTTKNNWYIYIQSDRQRSYNFYGNYTIGSTTNNLYYGAAANTLAAYSYGTQSWPLLILNAAQNHSNSSYKLYVKLLTDNNKSTRLYVGCGGYDNAEKNNFGTAKTLVNNPTHADYEAGLTQTIELSTAATGSNGSKQPVCSVLSMVYNGVLYEYLNQTESITNKQDSMDDCLGNLNAIEYLKQLTPSNNLATTVCGNPQVIPHFFNANLAGLTSSILGIIYDSIEDEYDSAVLHQRVLVKLMTNDFFANATSKVPSISNIIDKIPSSGQTKEYSEYVMQSMAQISIRNVTETTGIVKMPQINSTDVKLITTKMIGLAFTEYEELKALCIAEQLINARISLIEQPIRPINSSEGIQFTKSKLAVVGEDNNGHLVQKELSNDVWIYSLDGVVFCSVKFSKHIKLPISYNQTIERAV